MDGENASNVAGKNLCCVYFMEAGIASIVSTLEETGPTEVGIFGRENPVFDAAGDAFRQNLRCGQADWKPSRSFAGTIEMRF
jgi:hypothetical protein